ncbi:unnamed protein product [Mytilus edulis]|uniref:Uncharacterized protein n=1 Tax=Mytilus edulis TaxID=6550 RepID=A0A8S3TT97_MYTED|nr:unnamed protein product [Mytilus edulis]
MRYLNNTLGTFDAIVTYSSIEHSGLGRYGDALNPWGDIIAIARAWCVTKIGGSLTIGIPYNDDHEELVFNAHRVYELRDIKRLFRGFCCRISTQDNENVPPLPEVISSSACMATPCFHDKDCRTSEGRCCDNDIDWVREPRRQQVNGIYLSRGEAGKFEKDVPNLGHCIPEKDVFPTVDPNPSRHLETDCYLEKYLMADGAKIKVRNRTCYCKQGFLSCLKD